MIHVEPSGAGITLTFCVQHTHTHRLPTNTKEMCPQIPSPRALCAVFVCISVCKPVLLCVLRELRLFVDDILITYIIRLYPKFCESVYQKTACIDHVHDSWRIM